MKPEVIFYNGQEQRIPLTNNLRLALYHLNIAVFIFNNLSILKRY